jgi:hypothetical protein
MHAWLPLGYGQKPDGADYFLIFEPSLANRHGTARAGI